MDGIEKPLTLATARAAHLRIIVLCTSCHYYLEPNLAEHARRHGPDLPLSDWTDRLVCGQCGGSGPNFIVSWNNAIGESQKSVIREPQDRPAFEGWIDLVRADRVGGWAWDANRPADRLLIEVEVDGTVVTRTRAMQHRRDLQAAGRGDGRYAFTARLAEAPSGLLRCVIAGSSFALPLSASARQALAASRSWRESLRASLGEVGVAGETLRHP